MLISVSDILQFTAINNIEAVLKSNKKCQHQSKTHKAYYNFSSDI